MARCTLIAALLAMAAACAAAGAGEWELTDVIESPAAAADAIFGSTLHVDGDLAVIGAPYGDVADGLVFAYRRQNESPYAWRREAELVVPGVGTDALYGAALHARAGVVCVGAPGEGDGTGAAYVWELRGGEWGMVQRLAPSADEPGQNFGHACAVTPPGGVAVGAPYRDTEFGADRGAVDVFARTLGGSFAHTQRLVSPVGSDGDAFGFSVAAAPANAQYHADLSFYVVVGAPYYDRPADATAGVDAVPETGAVYEFAQPRGIDVLFFVRRYDNPTAGPLEQFGLALSYSDEFLAVSAPRAVLEDVRGGALDVTHEGAVYVYDRPDEESLRGEPQAVTAADVFADLAGTAASGVIVEEFGVALALGEGANAIAVAASKETFVGADPGGGGGPLVYEQRGALYFFVHESFAAGGERHDQLDRSHFEFDDRVSSAAALPEGAVFAGSVAFAEASAAHVLVGVRGPQLAGAVNAFTCRSCATVNGAPIVIDPPEPAPAPPPVNVNVDLDVDLETRESDSAAPISVSYSDAPNPSASTQSPRSPPPSPSTDLPLFIPAVEPPFRPQAPIIFEISTGSPAHALRPALVAGLAALLLSWLSQCLL